MLWGPINQSIYVQTYNICASISSFYNIIRIAWHVDIYIYIYIYVCVYVYISVNLIFTPWATPQGLICSGGPLHATEAMKQTVYPDSLDKLMIKIRIDVGVSSLSENDGIQLTFWWFMILFLKDGEIRW